MGWREFFGGDKAHTSDDVMREAEAARPPGTSAEPIDQITRLVRAGKKIEAIIEYRAVYGSDLVTAKDAIDAIARGQAPGSIPAPAVASRASTPTDAEVRSLVARDQIIPAIKLYREIHGTGLAEAKAAVDAMR